MAGNVLDDVMGEFESGAFDPSKNAAPPPIVDQAVSDIAAGIERRNHVSALRGQYADPGKYQEYQDVGKAFGLPTEIVRRNYDELSKRMQLDQTSSLLDNNPELAQWYGEGDNPEAIKYDELRHLSGLSWLWNSATQSLSSGLRNSEIANLRYKELIGQATDDEIARADKLSIEREPRTYGADSWLEKGWTGSWEQAPYMLSTYLHGAVRGLQSATIFAGGALLAGQAGPQAALPEEVITVPGAAAGGYIVGSKIGQWETAFKMEAGNTFDEIRSMKDENGMPMDRDVARVASIVAGFANATMEVYSFDKMAQLVPGLDKIGGAITKDTVKAALMKPTVRQALKTFAKNVFTSGATEVTTEVAQEASQAFAGELAKIWMNEHGGSFVGSSKEELVQRFGDIAEQTAQSMTVMGPLLGSTRLGKDIIDARRSANEAAVIGALNSHAEGSELRTRLPAKAQEAVDKMTANGPVNYVYVAPEAFQEYFQDAKDISEFMTRTGLTKEYNEASASGRDIEIPIGTYYANIAGTEIGNAIMGATRLSQSSMYADEAMLFNEAWSEAQNSLTGQAQSQDQVAQTDEIFNDVKNKAIDAGIVPDQAQQYATLYSKFFSVMGERTGVDPSVIYRKYGFDIRRSFGGEDLTGVDNVDVFHQPSKAAVGVTTNTDYSSKSLGTTATAVAKIFGAKKTGQGQNYKHLSGDDKKRSRYYKLDDGREIRISDHTRVSGYASDIDVVIDNEDGRAFITYNGDEVELVKDEDAGQLMMTAIDGTEFPYGEGFGGDGLAWSNAIIREINKAINENNSSTLKQGERGSIQFSNGTTIINMFEAADLSTFLHESGHFFLNVLQTEAQADETGSLLDDWARVRKYLGVGENGKITTDMHEKFARTFEAYLMEGKSPSDELLSVFARFRSWLLFVYRSIKDLNVPINSEIRGVMDRMLATDREIEDARAQPGFHQAFSSAEEAGMTPKQWEEYQALAGKAVETAKMKLQAKLLSEVSRETTSEWKRARKEIADQVASEYEKLPVYQVIKYLTTGKGDIVPEGQDRMFLDKKSVEDILGPGAVKKLPKGVPPIYRENGGVHADDMAEMFGFKSGHDMLTKMTSVEPFRRAVAEQTDVRMKQKYGDLLSDASERAREAEAAIANDATGELLQAEMEVLARKGLVTTKLNRQRAREIARQIVRTKTVREAVHVKMFMNAASKAGADAEAAIMKQDWKTAVAMKQRQMLNHYMAMAAIEAEKDTEAAVKYLNKFAGRSRPKGIPADYIDQIDTLLERFDFRKSVTLKDAQRRASLAEWIADQEAQGNLVAIPDELRNDAFRKPYKELTVDDLMTVRDAVKNIEHLGRLKDKLLANKQQREFEGVRDVIEASIRSSAPARKQSKNRNPTAKDKILSGMRSLDAGLLKIEQVLDWMDSDQEFGSLRKYVWEPIAQAEYKQNDMNAEYTGKILAAFDGLDQKRLAEHITVDAVDTTFTRSEIMAVALNMGNLSNLDKMLRGEGWNKGQLDEVVSHLNKEEWQTVQKVWDIINELWPQIEALQKRLSGVSPPKIKASPVETQFGVFPGGYFPVIYDPNRSLHAEHRAEARADAMFENTYLRPETWHGFAKERTQAYAKPLLFDLDGIGQHVINVIHDLTHREAIRDANKLLSDPAVVAAVDEHYGKEIRRQFTPWLQSIANDGFKNDGLDGWNKLFRKARSNATMMGLGFRISTVLAQTAGYFPIFDMVNAKHFAGAMKDFVSHPKHWSDTVNEMSGLMRHRQETLDRDIRDALRTLSGKKGIVDQAKQFAFYGIGIADRMVTVPAWMSAYTQHLESNPGDTEGAISYADKVVSLTQGGGGAKDLAAVSRSNEMTRMITMFYSYFSAMYARERTLGRDIKSAVIEKDTSQLPQLMARSLFVIVMPALAAELVVGRGPDDDETWSKWMARKIALYPFMSIPIARDIAGMLDTGYSYDFTPISRVFEAVVGTPIKDIDKIINGEAEPRKVVRHAIDAAGYVTGLPVGQLSTTMNNVWLHLDKNDLKLSDFMINRPK